VTQAARERGLSWPVVRAAFAEHAARVLPDQPQPVPALGIDETRRGKPRFALDTDTGVVEQITDRWHTGFVDLTGDQGLLGQVEGRSSGEAGSWPVDDHEIPHLRVLRGHVIPDLWRHVIPHRTG
jgi:hypothetical protein